jgi:hypothetical protein
MDKPRKSRTARKQEKVPSLAMTLFTSMASSSISSASSSCRRGDVPLIALCTSPRAKLSQQDMIAWQAGPLWRPPGRAKLCGGCGLAASRVCALPAFWNHPRSGGLTYTVYRES